MGKLVTSAEFELRLKIKRIENEKNELIAYRSDIVNSTNPDLLTEYENQLEKIDWVLRQYYQKLSRLKKYRPTIVKNFS